MQCRVDLQMSLNARKQLLIPNSLSLVQKNTLHPPLVFLSEKTPKNIWLEKQGQNTIWENMLGANQCAVEGHSELYNLV